MIQEACAMIERVEARERRSREAKYGRRNKIRYIDRLLNELEMLNLAEETRVPERLAIELDRLLNELEMLNLAEETRVPERLAMELGRLLAESEVVQPHQPRLESVNEAMDVLYELQDSLMFNETDEE